MRIKNREESQRLSFPIIGKIKIGKKSPSGYPMATDYFVATGAYARFFNDAYGEQPKSIQIIFFDDDENKVCTEQLVLRDKEGRRVAFSDGVTYWVYSERKSLYEPYLGSEHPDIQERLEKKAGSKFEVVLTIRFLIPKISGIMGFWELSTKGDETSVPQLVQAFDSLKESNGFVKGVIWDLSVKFHSSNKPNSKRRYPVLSLVPNHSKENIEMVKTNLIVGNNLLE